MDISIYQVDAFASRVFTGNPAAVCPLDVMLDDETLQNIAAENNLSETAFFVYAGDHFTLRWFTPAAEIDLCGHATLASAHILFEHLGFDGDRIHFETLCGPLYVHRRRDGLLEMDFPAWRSEPVKLSALAEPFLRALGALPVEARASRDLMLVYETPRDIEALAPDIADLATIEQHAVIVTAPGRPGEEDFVSRFFAPKLGVPEDPVTGSAHSTLIPYWAKRLGMENLFARQLSKRGGELHCRMMGDRVAIAGQCVPYMVGTISI
jgi:PhzF family phenazine biosynthesis protein